ncbi:MAG: response regulator [Nitrospinota bacterium]|nr:response regulator [Nitrospinota bacterium]
MKSYGSYAGFFFGAMLFAFLYNMFLFVSLQDRVYLYYSIWIGAVFMLYYSNEGYAFRYLWPEHPYLFGRVSNTFACLAWFGMILFIRTFLDTKVHFPKAEKTLKYILWIYISLFPANFIIHDLRIALNITFLTGNIVLIVGLSVAILSVLKGNRAARFFLLGTTFTFVGSMANLALALGYAPDNFMFYHSAAIGTLIDAFLLSFALSDRVKILREEKAAAQVAAIESEKAARQIETRAKEELETKVEERTCELAGEKERAEQAREQAEAANKLKDQFVTLVSHDLRAPLGNIMGLMELFREKTRGAELDGRHLNLLDRAANNCNGLIGMIDRLLDISRLRSGRMRVTKRFILTRYMLEDRIERLTHSAREKRISITMEVPQGHRIFADENLFGEVVQNIVSNAIKFLDEGGQVTIRAEGGPSGAIVITDNGPGIGDAILPDIFNAHKKTSTRGTKGEKGMGLGLPLSQDIMKAHGGKIQVESVPGDGATFRLTLPEAKVTALVVDDNEATRVEVADQLRAMEVDVVEAANGADALDRIAEQTPHVVIADILMPQMDGWALLNFIRKSPSMDGVPVIMFTSSDEIAAREKAFRLGASDFVMKPIVTNDFIPRVRRFVRV